MGWNSSVFPLLIVYSSGGTPTGFFQYSPAPGVGTLVASLTEASKDPYGNAAIPGGLATYNNSAGQAVLVASNGLFLYTGSLSTHWTLSTVAFTLGSNGLSATSPLNLEEIAVPAAITAGPWIFGNTSGHLEAVSDTTNGDGNSYDVERLFLHGTALPQAISSVTPATITGCSKTNLGLGRYRYKAYISFHGAAAAGTARFCIAGTLVTSSFDIAAMFITNTGVANNGTSATFGSGGFVQSPTLTTGANIAYIEGELVVSTAGSVLLQAFEGTTGDAFTVDNCKFDLFPVVAS